MREFDMVIEESICDLFADLLNAGLDYSEVWEDREVTDHERTMVHHMINLFRGIAPPKQPSE